MDWPPLPLKIVPDRSQMVRTDCRWSAVRGRWQEDWLEISFNRR